VCQLETNFIQQNVDPKKIGLKMENVEGLSDRAKNSLDVEDGVPRVHSGLVLGGLTDQTLLVGERDEGGGSVATLIVGN
jgi:hypothetical protein